MCSILLQSIVVHLPDLIHQRWQYHSFGMFKKIALEIFSVELYIFSYIYIASSVVEWLKHHAYDQHGLGSKPIHTILWCPWERHSMAFSPAWWSWQVVLNYSHIFIKLQMVGNILASPKAGWGDCLLYKVCKKFLDLLFIDLINK